MKMTAICCIIISGLCSPQMGQARREPQLPVQPGTNLHWQFRGRKRFMGCNGVFYRRQSRRVFPQLNSIADEDDASGSPSGFTVMVYTLSNLPLGGLFPGSSLGTLSGSANPATSGIYTYTAPADLVLSPSTLYFIVLTGGTAVATGADEWSYTGANSYTPAEDGAFWAVAIEQSSNGSSWVGRLPPMLNMPLPLQTLPNRGSLASLPSVVCFLAFSLERVVKRIIVNGLFAFVFGLCSANGTKRLEPQLSCPTWDKPLPQKPSERVGSDLMACNAVFYRNPFPAGISSTQDNWGWQMPRAVPEDKRSWFIRLEKLSWRQFYPGAALAP